MPCRSPSRCPGCRQLQDQPGRCPLCRSQARHAEDARRGSATQRGYDGRHRREAETAKADAVARRVPCPRCHQPLLPGEALDYGHTVARSIDPSSRADRVEHARCNRRAGARDG